MPPKKRRPKYGDTSLWPGNAAPAPTLRAALFGSQTSTNTTSEVITLPAYTEDDFIILIVARNQLAEAGYSGGANANVSNGAIGDGRCSVLSVIPQNGATSFTLTADAGAAAGIWRWWIASYKDVDLFYTENSATTSSSNTTAAIAIPPATLRYISSGNEIAISAACVNATATWSTTDTILASNASGNASLCIAQHTVPPDVTAIAFPDTSRGNAGSSRAEASACIVLSGAKDESVHNWMSNASFENGATLATFWEDEHTTTNAATYSLTPTGNVDGVNAQRIQYTGVGGDAAGNKVLEIFQIPNEQMVAGDVLQFEVYMSGSITGGAVSLIGIEGFDVNGGYLSEHDEYFTVTGTPTKYTCQYTCPALTDYVAVYLQINEIGSSAAIDIKLDSARLYKS